MYIKKLELVNFRSYDSLKLDFLPGINVLYGENGTGKTNILEAIYCLSMVRSFRTSEDFILVKHGKETAVVNAEVSDNELDKLFSLEYNIASRRKILKENNSKLSRMGDMIGKLPVVLFSPENIYMVKGEPVLRRRFIDDLISQVDAEYFNTLAKYVKEIAHRNYLLKGIKEGKVKKDSLKIWNEQITGNGIKILIARIKAVEALNAILKNKLLDNKIEINLVYVSKQMNDFSESAIKARYQEFFEKNIDEEIARATTLIGPHRDDIDIFYRGQPAKQFASEGQQRITAILIKLAEGLMIREKRGSYPVVLLDDFSSELDNPNRSFIGKTFAQFKQIIITTTYKENLKGFEPAKEFHVDAGKVRAV
jgi:DNA replication and repair protein RecF